MKTFIKHIRIYILRGLLAMIPIFLCILAIQLLYFLIDKRVMVFFSRFFEVRKIPGLGILLVLLCLYFIGLIVSNVIGKRLFHYIERISRRIPLINSIYQLGKQFSESFSGEAGKEVFKKVVLVDWNNNGTWALGFVTGRIIDQRGGEPMLRVFVPNVPSPTTGFIFIVRENAAIDPGWTVEEALKMVISGSVIAPKEIKNKS
ncbi:MAG: DUF502 domain-containing protein [Candidatus Omnitrophica bacterium]|nr:DUF502 domain-containing protein [Candidatus Omnitrophota bacterium]